MNTRILAAATAIALGLGTLGAAAQDDMSMEQGFNMLTGAVYNALSREGFDTTNIDKLSLAEIALIRQFLSADMGGNERQQVQKILDDAAAG